METTLTENGKHRPIAIVTEPYFDRY